MIKLFDLSLINASSAKIILVQRYISAIFLLLTAGNVSSGYNFSVYFGNLSQRDEGGGKLEGS